MNEGSGPILYYPAVSPFFKVQQPRGRDGDGAFRVSVFSIDSNTSCAPLYPREMADVVGFWFWDMTALTVSFFFIYFCVAFFGKSTFFVLFSLGSWKKLSFLNCFSCRWLHVTVVFGSF